MVSTEAVALSIKIARGLIKLAGRVDLVLAEKAAVESPLALPQAPVALPPTPEKMRRGLKKLLADHSVPEGEAPSLDPLGADRAAIQSLLNQSAPAASDLFPFYQKHLPEQALGSILDLRKAFAREVRRSRPDWPVDDPSVLVAAYYIAPGESDREKGYTWRIALNVVDVLAEFGAENAALFTRDERVQSLVGAVIQRFADADVQTVDSWSAVLRVALLSTLNGALDAKGAIAGDDPWMGAVLNALAGAREASDTGDNFLVGLVLGNGYPLLVAHVLEETAGRLRPEDAEPWQAIAADVLTSGAELLESRPSFTGFFNDHWADLLRAGLSSVADHGPEILEGESPLLRETLVAILGRLSVTPGISFLTPETVVAIGEAAVGAVAADPDLLDDEIEAEWLKTLIGSVARTVSTQGIRRTFTQEAIQSLAIEVLITFSEQPELLVREPGLVQELVRQVLTKVASSGSFAAEDLATTAVNGALTAIAENPALLGFSYADLVATLSGKVADLVHERTLTRIQGTDLLDVLTQSVAENPQLFLDAQTRLTGVVIDAVLGAADEDPNKLLAGTVLVELMAELLDTVARTGRGLPEDGSAAALTREIQEVLEVGLTRAGAELGHRLSRRDLPVALAALLGAWMRGELASLDPDDPNFKRVFSALIDKAVA